MRAGVVQCGIRAAIESADQQRVAFADRRALDFGGMDSALGRQAHVRPFDQRCFGDVVARAEFSDPCLMSVMDLHFGMRAAESGAAVEQGVCRGAQVVPLIDRLCAFRSEEHTSELQSLMRISYAVFCLKKTK